MTKTIIAIISIILFAFFVILFVACLLEALFPRWCWKTFESWKATKEPTKEYFLKKRMSAIIIMVIILVIALAPALIAYFDK